MINTNTNIYQTHTLPKIIREKIGKLESYHMCPHCISRPASRSVNHVISRDVINEFRARSDRQFSRLPQSALNSKLKSRNFTAQLCLAAWLGSAPFGLARQGISTSSCQLAYQFWVQALNFALSSSVLKLRKNLKSESSKLVTMVPAAQIAQDVGLCGVIWTKKVILFENGIPRPSFRKNFSVTFTRIRLPVSVEWFLSSCWLEPVTRAKG